MLWTELYCTRGIFVRQVITIITSCDQTRKYYRQIYVSYFNNKTPWQKQLDDYSLILSFGLLLVNRNLRGFLFKMAHFSLKRNILFFISRTPLTSVLRWFWPFRDSSPCVNSGNPVIIEISVAHGKTSFQMTYFQSPINVLFWAPLVTSDWNIRIQFSS